MAALLVNSILAVPDIPTRNSNGYVVLGQETIWNTVQNFIDGPSGSIAPATFKTPGVQEESYTVPITFTGTFVFPQQAVGQTYVLSASIAIGASVVQVLQSSKILVPAANLATPGNVKATGFQLVLPNFGLALCPLPFRWAGDFVWSLQLGGVSIPALIPTRLELCWIQALPPNGPTTPPIADIRSRVNFGGAYPIGLFRWFSPSPTEFPQNLPTTFASWYLQRSMNLIWNWPQNAQNPNPGTPQYDSQYGGRSYYGMAGEGGSFMLSQWLVSFQPLCNCYDLAAISQLACAILVDQAGEELVLSDWVYQEPNGFINSGPLYGRMTGVPNMTCNNPFWAQSGMYYAFVAGVHEGLAKCGGKVPQQSPHVDPASTSRTSFGNHAWVEVSPGANTPNDRRVLDATHALWNQGNPPPTPDAGTRTRAGYLAAQLDQTRPHRNGTTDCYYSPATRLERIGVISIDNIVVGAGGPGPMGGIPEFMRDRELDIERVLRIGGSPQQPELSFNAAPVDPQTLISQFFTGLTHELTRLSISPTATNVAIRFAGTAMEAEALETVPTTSAPQATKAETIIIELSVFDIFERTDSALKSHLRGFQVRPLGTILSRPDTPLGAVSLSGPSSIFWVRGNVFVHIYTTGPSTQSIINIATQLDKHLASKVDPVDSPGPSVSLENTPSQNITPGEQFTVQIESDGSLLQEKLAFSEATSVVLPAGPSTEQGILRFFAMEPGRTTVRVRVADAVTLRPGEASFEVGVGEPSS